MSDWEEHDKKFMEKAESLPEIRCSRSKHWRLLEGALITTKDAAPLHQRGRPARVLEVFPYRSLPEPGRVSLYAIGSARTYEEMYWADATPSHYFPVLTDPATLGGLLALAREAWKDEGLAVVANYDHENGYQWRVVGGHHHGSTFMTMRQKRYSTEAEALIAALEAAE
tara:strand:+ start:441 stop:947 length:507 start_codon:yes stop_codon:yes gene_type:complete